MWWQRRAPARCQFPVLDHVEGHLQAIVPESGRSALLSRNSKFDQARNGGTSGRGALMSSSPSSSCLNCEGGIAVQGPSCTAHPLKSDPTSHGQSTGRVGQDRTHRVSYALRARYYWFIGRRNERATGLIDLPQGLKSRCSQRCCALFSCSWSHVTVMLFCLEMVAFSRRCSGLLVGGALVGRVETKS